MLYSPTETKLQHKYLLCKSLVLFSPWRKKNHKKKGEISILHFWSHDDVVHCLSINKSENSLVSVYIDRELFSLQLFR